MARTFASKEALAQHLVSDPGFLKLKPEERDVVFQEGLKQVQPSSEIGQGAKTIGAPTALSMQEAFPMTSQASQPLPEAQQTHPSGQMRQPPLPLAIPLDILRLAGALPGAGVNIAEDAMRGRGFHPGQAYTQAFRGGRIDPTVEGQRMRGLTETAVGMVPFGKIIPPVANRLANVIEQTPMPQIRLPSLRPPKLLTTQDVLAMPQSRFPKMTKAERAEFFRARASEIKLRTQAATEALHQERVAIQKELGKVATQRSLELRPAVPGYLSRESKHYRALADAELAPLANEVVETRELANFVKARYPYPNQAEELAEVSSRLGLSNENLVIQKVSPLVDELGRPIQQTIPTTRKLGELYEQAKDFGQEIPRAARESMRTYSRAEHFTDNTIHVLYDYLKEKGINLTEANAHWSRWARIRNQLVAETRPYNLAGTQTESFSRRLIKIAKGIDPDNAVYAKTVAEGLGVPDLPGPIKGIVAKLDSNQKALVATKLSSEMAQEELRQLRFQMGQLHRHDPKRAFQILGFIRRWFLPGMGGRY